MRFKQDLTILYANCINIDIINDKSGPIWITNTKGKALYSIGDAVARFYTMTDWDAFDYAV